MSKSTGITDGDTVVFTCDANVGKPPGSIRWWIFRKSVDFAEEIFTAHVASSPIIYPWVCKYNITSFVTVTLTKEDDQAVIRCSVEQDLVTSPTGLPEDKLYQETQRIDVQGKVLWEHLAF